MNERVNTLKFTEFDDCIGENPKSYILENVIAMGDDSSWFGPPGSMKSALLTEIAVSIASERDWRGHKYEDTGMNGVIYFALERGALTKRRFAAYKTRDNLSGLPIRIIDKTINLLDPACVDQIVGAIEQFYHDKSVNVGLVIIDTYSKAISAGDEDKAQTQNIAANHLKFIHDRVSGLHIATVGHTGKNEGAGERGSNARLGHVDLAVQITGGDVRTATVVKANDQPAGPLASFEMEEITVHSEFGPYTVAILAAHTPAAVPKAGARMNAKQTQALDALKRVIETHGQDGAVPAEYWKEELTRVGRIKADDKNDRTTFRRIQDSVSQQIIEVNGFVRIVPQPPPSPL